MSGEMQDAAEPPYRILLVEDHRPVSTLTSMFLDMEGFQVDVAESGSEALERLKSSDYLLVLMDINMRDMTGLEVTRLHRAFEASEGGKPAYIVGATANSQAANRVSCLAVGMDDFLSKPYSPAELKQLIEEHISSL